MEVTPVATVIGLILLFLVRYSQESCMDMDAGISPTKVATMCTDSVVYGTSNVYIDTSLAGSMTIATGLVCTCNVQTQVGKVIHLTSMFAGVQGSDCGTTIQYDTGGLPGSYKNVSCQTEQFDVSSQRMTINFNKDKTPYQSEYCLDIQLVYCNGTDFQCNDGECVTQHERCDNIPACKDESDEQNCGTVTCVEGLVLCDDGLTCIAPDKRCDGHPDCPDSSDEPASCGGVTTVSSIQTTSTPKTPTIPQIIVTCAVSSYTPTTTTTSTTTRSTTPTTTTTTSRSTTPTTTENTTPTINEPKTTPKPKDDGSNTVIYIVVVVVLVLVLIIILSIAAVLYRKYKTWNRRNVKTVYEENGVDTKPAVHVFHPMSTRVPVPRPDPTDHHDKLFEAHHSVAKQHISH